MRYLFIVQGEGRGHLTQAIALSDILRRNGHEVVEVLLGESKQREIPRFFIEKIASPVLSYPCLSFVYKKELKELSLFRTILYNAKPKQLRKYKKSLEFVRDRIHLCQPDAVICFYETLSSFARSRYNITVPFINVGHQFLIEHPDYCFGKESPWKMTLYRLFNLINTKGAAKNLALSFYPMPDCDEKKIAVVPPLLRNEVLTIKTEEKEHILVYILNPGYEVEVREWHEKNPTVKLACFWDKKGAPKELKVDETLSFFTIDDKRFVETMASCRGYVSTAGFESICEAFYMKKPVMMVPAHLEQEINAADASSTGYGVANSNFNIDVLFDYMNTNRKNDDDFKSWVDSAEPVFLKEILAVSPSHSEQALRRKMKLSWFG